MKQSITAIVFVNNAISARMALAVLQKDGVPLEHVALILIRKIHFDWFDKCGICLPYPRKPSLSLMGQWPFLKFYRDAASLLRRLLKSSQIKTVYLINFDNLLTNHVMNWAEKHREIEVCVLAEGLMNYQDIQIRNRAWWRSAYKILLTPLLGLRWRTPKGHLSGSFEPAVSRVIGFAPGVIAPPEKVEVIPFPVVAAARPPQADIALIAYTGIWQWMTEDKFKLFAESFVTWLKSRNYRKLLVKPHPHYSEGPLEKLMPAHEVVKDTRNLEEMAGEIDAATVISFNCTALVTLKMIRPDLHCIDYGFDFYSVEAYKGDRSVEAILRASGVELVPMIPSSEPALAVSGELQLQRAGAPGE